MTDTFDVRLQLPPELRTVRSRIKQQIIDDLKAAKFYAEQDPLDDTAIKLFETVGIGGLEDIKPVETPACKIEEGNEDIFPDTNMIVQKRLRLFFNVKIIYASGVDAAELVNYYFARIVQVVVSNPHIADLTLCVDEAGNSLQINGANDPEPGGTLFLDIDYRHAHANPFTSI